LNNERRREKGKERKKERKPKEKDRRKKMTSRQLTISWYENECSCPSQSSLFGSNLILSNSWRKLSNVSRHGLFDKYNAIKNKSSNKK